MHNNSWYMIKQRVKHKQRFVFKLRGFYAWQYNDYELQTTVSCTHNNHRYANNTIQKVRKS